MRLWRRFRSGCTGRLPDQARRSQRRDCPSAGRTSGHCTGSCSVGLWRKTRSSCISKLVWQGRRSADGDRRRDHRRVLDSAKSAKHHHLAAGGIAKYREGDGRRNLLASYRRRPGRPSSKIARNDQRVRYGEPVSAKVVRGHRAKGEWRNVQAADEVTCRQRGG
ncbi:hypothetical protein CISG_08965 [Coccidioides immitis RMSCC 3703]|uniref:Uncharacterized protein n=1 Tax=Coccidioides immitis RMSCC 3703 TaxID=454286 RepID=A0A0J8R732_COCIT|nr:hypothetical protein CISG_08965 [Coccidioides immitis RMSCC 3703]